MSSTNVWADSDTATILARVTDNGLSDDDEDFVYPGGGEDMTYASQMEELFDGDASDSHGPDLDDDEDQDEFVYEGADSAAQAFNYREQLRDVLDQDHSEEEVEQSPVADTDDDEPLDHGEDALPVLSPSASEASQLSPPSRISTPDSRASYAKLPRTFLHPSVSRLRSHTPQTPSSIGTPEPSFSHLFHGGASPDSSRFASLSRVSSVSGLQSLAAHSKDTRSPALKESDVFEWRDLQVLTQAVFSKASQKASSLLGTPVLGLPTTLAVNGMICIGTTEGKIVVHDFKQTLICVCESTIPVKDLGPVTALALSHDHTFVASGHASGFILLYDLKLPRNPVRTVAPTTLKVVSTGRKEGHIIGSRIINIGFISTRHTGLVSADEMGLAFFHSLGKVLFVEAPDILRILGKYPDPTSPVSPGMLSPEHKRARLSILSMAPLPLGSTSHPTDIYHVVALLTPFKLVVVGLKPLPRTWFKCAFESIDDESRKSKLTGCLAWYPTHSQPGPPRREADGTITPTEIATNPMLVYTRGPVLRLLSISETRRKQSKKNDKTGKTLEIDVGLIVHQQLLQWSAEEDILAVQWLNIHQIAIFTRKRLSVFDIRLGRLVEKTSFEGSSLLPLSRDIGPSQNEKVQHSVRSYKGKLFLMYRDKVSVGTLLTWADRILSLVKEGDFLQAIELARAYYLDTAPGNRNNLPDNPSERQQVIAAKLRSLMVATVQYAFSEQRMTDHTHVTPDGRGVDRTSFFEELVRTCCRACIALEDTEFLFEDVFQKYDDNGIVRIYLRQIESFVLNKEIHIVPPRITQQLIALQAEEGRPDLVERIIWHIDPSCLDLNQTITLCQRYGLYDALIYIYTGALKDYVAPIVELLDLIRKLRRHQKASPSTSARLDESAFETLTLNAHKIYPYLANILSGLGYPGDEPLQEEDALQAKKDVYTFLFFGRSSLWPPGPGGRLILTAEEEGGMEPTYPYMRQLLTFDAESFLHALDIAFEDTFFNDESQTISRSMIIHILMEMVSDGSLIQEDVTLVNIFIARNVPKYHQYIQLSPSPLHALLVGLASDPDPSTKEDRQLAAEFVLSIYRPYNVEAIVDLFERAGFYRILRMWYTQDRKWGPLLATYVEDPDISSFSLLDKADDVMATARKLSKDHTLPPELIQVIDDSLPRLLHADVSGTALLIDKFSPEMHDDALETMDLEEEPNFARYEYLWTLMVPRPQDDSLHSSRQRHIPNPSSNVSEKHRNTFFELHCRYHSQEVIQLLESLPEGSFDPRFIISTCEKNEIFDAVVWELDRQGEPQQALSKADEFQKKLCRRVLVQASHEPSTSFAESEIASLQRIGRIGQAICLERSQASSSIEVPLEDVWFQLLNSQIQSVQTLSNLLSDGAIPPEDQRTRSLDGALSTLRGLVQATFGALVSVSSTSGLSFPRLFKRLVDSASSTSAKTHYTEFRIILTGMLDSYRSDEDILVILRSLVERDLFETTTEISKERARGWCPSRETCHYCRSTLRSGLQAVGKGKGVALSEEPQEPPQQIVVSRTGEIYHLGCKPRN